MKQNFILGIAVILAFFAYSSLASAVLPQGLVFLVTFDEGKGDKVKDMSGFGNNGTVVGKADWVNGKSGSGFHFNGATHITVPNAKPLSELTHPMSAGVWTKPEVLAGWSQVIEMDGATGWKLGFNVANVVWTTYNVQDFTAAGKVIKIGDWTHIAATWDGKQAIIYVNGEPEPPIAGAGVINVKNEPSLDMGYRSTTKSSYYTGILDDAFVFNRVIKQAEIKEMMGGFAGLLAVDSNGKLAATWGDIKKP
jgi:hypothetical protein